ETRHLRHGRKPLKQEAHGLERKWLMQWCQGDIIAQIVDNCLCHTDWFQIVLPAMYDAVHYGDQSPPLQTLCNPFANKGQCRRVLVFGAKLYTLLRTTRQIKLRPLSADAMHLATPQWCTRQWLQAGIKGCELDTG